MTIFYNIWILRKGEKTLKQGVGKEFLNWYIKANYPQLLEKHLNIMKEMTIGETYTLEITEHEKLTTSKKAALPIK